MVTSIRYSQKDGTCYQSKNGCCCCCNSQLFPHSGLCIFLIFFLLLFLHRFRRNLGRKLIRLIRSPLVLIFTMLIFLILTFLTKVLCIFFLWTCIGSCKRFRLFAFFFRFSCLSVRKCIRRTLSLLCFLFCMLFFCVVLYRILHIFLCVLCFLWFLLRVISQIISIIFFTHDDTSFLK